VAALEALAAQSGAEIGAAKSTKEMAAEEAQAEAQEATERAEKLRRQAESDVGLEEQLTRIAG
jgi:hypothetical protein